MWQAYATLDSCRTAGFAGPNPISFDQMQAMANELKIKKPEDRDRFYKRIKILDFTYMDFVDKKSKSKESTK